MSEAELEKSLRAIENRLKAIETLLHLQAELPSYGLVPRHERLFNVLLSREGKFVSKDSLMTLLWPGLDRSDKLPEVLLSGLRKEIRERNLPFDIINQFGHGWKLQRKAHNSAENG